MVKLIHLAWWYSFNELSVFNYSSFLRFYLFCTSYNYKYYMYQLGWFRNELAKSTQLFVKVNNAEVKTRNIYAYATVITILTNRISPL